MGQAKGSASRIVVDWETAYGTPKTTTKTGKIIPFNSCDLKATRPLATSEAIRANRNPIAPYTGNKEISGNLVCPVCMESIGWLLKAAIGTPTTTGAGPYTHVFKVDDIDSLASFCLEKGYTDLTTPYYELFKGVKVNTLGLNISSDGQQLIATLGLMGADLASGTTVYDASAAALGGNPVKLADISAIKEGGSAIANLRTWALNLNNNLDGDTFCLGGGGVRGSLPEGLAQINGSVNALFDSTTLLAKGDGATESSLEVTFTQGTSSLNIKLPELVYEPNSIAIPSPKGLLLDLNYAAYYGNDAGASAIIVTLINSTASYA